MLVEDQQPVFDFWPERDPRCEGCGRSLVTHTDGWPPEECPSCESDFDLLTRAGKVRLRNWTLRVVKIGTR